MASHNQISSLPADFVSRLSGLHLFFLENNMLEMLPDTICGLGNLELLRVDCNQLKYLPDGLGKMTNLIGTTLVMSFRA